MASLGIATDFSYYEAIQKALIENTQGRVSVSYNRRDGLKEKEYQDNFSDVLSFTDHSYVYSTDKKFREKIRFIEKGQKNELKEVENEMDLNLLVKVINKKGYNVYLKDVTTEDISDGVGLKVGRAVIPGLTHLHGIHPYPFLGSKRLYQPGKVFSWCDKLKSVEEEIIFFPPHLLG